jgi:hypothetical protein
MGWAAPPFRGDPPHLRSPLRSSSSAAAAIGPGGAAGGGRTGRTARRRSTAAARPLFWSRLDRRRRGGRRRLALPPWSPPLPRLAQTGWTAGPLPCVRMRPTWSAAAAARAAAAITTTGRVGLERPHRRRRSRCRFLQQQ